MQNLKRSQAVPKKAIPIHRPRPVPVHPFDRLHRTETGGLLPRSAILTGHPSDAHLTAYYAVAPSILDGLIDLWLTSQPPLPIDRYTFLDVGAGKGRAMLTASLHPFERVCGIELNPSLAAVARRNLTLFSAGETSSPLAPVDLLEGDVLEVALPAGPTLAFLFHPFEAPLLRRFLARLEQVYASHPGRLDLLYVNAEHCAVLDRNPAFKRIFYGPVPMSSQDHLADLAEIAEQKEYGSTGDEICAIFRFTGRKKKISPAGPTLMHDLASHPVRPQKKPLS